MSLNKIKNLAKELKSGTYKFSRLTRKWIPKKKYAPVEIKKCDFLEYQSLMMELIKEEQEKSINSQKNEKCLVYKEQKFHQFDQTKEK